MPNITVYLNDDEYNDFKIVENKEVRTKIKESVLKVIKNENKKK